MEPYRVRTSYEQVVAHRAKLPFAYAAQEDGVVEKIDSETQVMRIHYPKSNTTVAIDYGDMYTKNGGGGFYCTQNIIINGYKEKDKFKKGDVLIYNEKFFTPDVYTKQVEWCLGVSANVACVEFGVTYEDGNAISMSLADKLAFNPVHVRDIVISRTTNIHEYADVGKAVINTDPILIFDQSTMSDDMFGNVDEETTTMLSKLNRQTPKAKYTGRIVRIEAYHRCDMADMSKSLKSLCNKLYKAKEARAKVASTAVNSKSFTAYPKLTETTRIGMTDLDDDTVILRFYIQQDMPCSGGDKIEFGGPFKSVCSKVQTEDWEVEDGSVKVQALFSSLGIQNRICMSPLVTGMAARICEKVEQDILEMYFN